MTQIVTEAFGAAEGRPVRSAVRLWGILAATAAVSMGTALLLARIFPAPPDTPLPLRLALAAVLWVVTVVPSWELTLALSAVLLPRTPPLPRLDLSSGVTPAHPTVVALPVILVDGQQVDDLCRHLGELHGVIADPDVRIAVLTDFEDAATPEATPVQRQLLDRLAGAVEDLNAATAGRPFVLLHRDASFCATQQLWMGRERKRGKLEDLMAFTVAGECRFSRQAGDHHQLRGAEYALVVDEHAHVPAGALQALVGTASHPMNHPHLSADGRRVVGGYGIFAPQVLEGRRWEQDARADGVTLRRDPLQDVFGQSGFAGNGLIHIPTYDRVMRGLLPRERVLSHDAAEASFLPTAAVVDVALLEQRRASYEARVRRKHRWIRGAWQNAMCLPRNGRFRLMLPLARWLLVMRVMSSLFPIAAVCALAAGAVIRPAGLLIALPLLGAPGLLRTVGAMRGAVARRRYADAWLALKHLSMVPVAVAMAMSAVLHDALIAADAICRTLTRLATGRGLLEWEPSVKSGRISAVAGARSLCTSLWRIEAAGGLALAATAALLTRHHTLTGLLLVWGGTAALNLHRANRRKQQLSPLDVGAHA